MLFDEKFDKLLDSAYHIPNLGYNIKEGISKLKTIPSLQEELRQKGAEISRLKEENAKLSQDVEALDRLCNRLRKLSRREAVEDDKESDLQQWKLGKEIFDDANELYHLLSLTGTRTDYSTRRIYDLKLRIEQLVQMV